VLHLDGGKSGKPGSGQGSGSGMGGPGQGAGGQAPESEGAVEFKDRKIKGKPSDKGRITGAIFVKGMGEKGEASVAYRDAVQAFERAAEDALEETEIPLERQTLVREYFDRIRPADAGEKK